VQDIGIRGEPRGPTGKNQKDGWRTADGQQETLCISLVCMGVLSQNFICIK